MKIKMQGKTAEVLLYEDIGGWFGTTADAFIKEIKSHGDLSKIVVRINSNGGNVFDGVAIGNYLKAHKAAVEVHIDGLAASIASIIAMAADKGKLYMAGNAWMMIHDPWIMTAGTANDLRQTAETMDGIRESLLDTYMRRATSAREKISDMMTAETWLNASDAQEQGLIDSVTDELQVAASVDRRYPFKNVPSCLRPQNQLAKPQHKRVKEILARMAPALHRYSH